MKRRIAYSAVVFLAGAVVGGAAAGYYAYRSFQNLFAHMYTVGVTGQVFMAGEIRAGRTDGLVEHFEASIPDYARGVQMFSESDQTLWALSSLKEYSLRNKLPLPTELEDVEVIPGSCDVPERHAAQQPASQRPEPSAASRPPGSGV